MRLIAIADHHWNEHSRWEECLRIHEWVSELVERERPDALLSAGDIYERASTPKERQAVAAWIQDVAGTCPVIIAKGNHDRQLDCALLGHLEARHEIRVVESCGTVVLGDRLAPGAFVDVMAWPSKASVAAMSGQALPAVGMDAMARDCLRDVLRGFGAQREECLDVPHVLLGHFMIDGAKTSTGQPLIGCEMNVSLEDLALSRADIVVAGHVHRPQEWEVPVDGRMMPVLYTGSPYRTAFGETEQKSVLMIELEAGGAPRWSRIRTPARQMQLVTGELTMGLLVTLENIDGRERDAEIRFRYTTPADRREDARRQAQEIRDKWIAAGAHSVKLEEEVAVQTRARVPEVTTARTLRAKLEAMWGASGSAPAPERRERLLGKLSELETQA